MKFYVILIALHFAAAYIECNSNVARKERNGSSGVGRSQRSVHNRNHIKGDKNWEEDDKYKYMVVIGWWFKAEKMKLKTHEEIGKIKDQLLHYKCSGVVIQGAWVITSASCFQPKIRKDGKRKGQEMTFNMRANSYVRSRFQNRTFASVYIHTDYLDNARKNDVDIALLQVVPSFTALETPHPQSVGVARLGENMPYYRDLNENGMKQCRVMSYGQAGITAEPPFTQKLSMSDVTAGGPKYCEMLHRLHIDPWYDQANPMDRNALTENDMFDSYFICTMPYNWDLASDRERPQSNEEGLGCFGAVGGALICEDSNVLVGILSQRFEQRYCQDKDSYTTFTSVGDRKVSQWIHSKIPNIRALVPLTSRWIHYPNISDLFIIGEERNKDSATTTTVSTCVGLILSLALSVTAFTF